jgi:hypothetical protein
MYLVGSIIGAVNCVEPLFSRIHFCSVTMTMGCRDSVVGIATCYALDD